MKEEPTNRMKYTAQFQMPKLLEFNANSIKDLTSPKNQDHIKNTSKICDDFKDQQK